MALRTPPSWEQNASHPAENDRLTTQALWATTGIIGTSSLATTQNSPAGMSVVVAAGWAAIVGTTQPNMGAYVVYNDASTVLTISTANPTNPRIDLICATINDSYYSGSTNNVVFQVIAGTPSGSPAVPALPANSIAIAQVAVAAAATSITNANISDLRTIVTTNLPIGDITSVTAGNGLSGGGTSGAVSLAIDTTITADLSTAQTLTNKNLSSGTNTFPTSLVTLTGSQTLTNKTLTSPLINIGLNAQSGTSYSLQATDNGKFVTCSNAGSITVTIPPSIGTDGAQITVGQFGAGQITFAQGSGVTIVSTGATASAPKTRAQYSTVTAICTNASSDSWWIVGDLV